MARNPVLTLLLLLVHLLLDLVIWRMAFQQPVGSPAQIALIAMLRTQLSLLALYLALGTSHWLWRLLALVGGLAIWSGAFWHYQYAGLTLAPIATMFTILILPPLLIGLLARGKGLLWGQWPHARSAGTLAPQQFSLAATFRWLTLSALCLGLIKLADFPVVYWDVWFRVSLINTFLTFALLWSLAFMRWKVFQICFPLLVALVVTLCCQVNPAHAWVTKFLLQVAFMFGTIEISGLAGWPLERKGVERHVRYPAIHAHTARE